MTSLVALKKAAKAWLGEMALPARARAARRLDSEGLPAFDPGPERAIEEGLAWLGRAQDHSKTGDGGAARHYSLIDGWSSSYPETTGYIVETLIAQALETSQQELIGRARRMLDWLVSIQFPEGAFQGGMVDQLPRAPTIFNTGQILIGLAAGCAIDSGYEAPMKLAADWLVRNQDEDGCWRKYNSPFAAPGDKVYDTHVAIGLFRAAARLPGYGYLEAASANVTWALSHQHPNGWFDWCCLTDRHNPLTHTLGYTLRGIVEAYLATKQAPYLQAACRTADGLLQAFEADGRLPGRLTSQWRAAVPWVCLTGTAQIAESLFLLAGNARRDDYRVIASNANRFVRRTLNISGPPETRGAVKGSFPVDGWYGCWQYLNWACKFMIDANRAELRH
jgi:hypothetical protein